jgi:condensation enzyme
MTISPGEPDMTPARFPLSSTQEQWCAGDLDDKGGTFSPRFLSTRALRITGQIDITAFQGALDDLVRRHETFRTVIERHAIPRYQQVYPTAGPVPLLVRDHTLPAGRSRDEYAEELILEAERGSMDPCQVPKLRANVERLDDRDSILILTTHHTSADGWSMQLILRDLAEFYSARVNGRSPVLSAARQYREFVAWEQSRVANSDANNALGYWREKLRGARIFALPADRPVREVHTQPYSGHHFTVDASEMASITAFARAMRCSASMALMAGFSVLAYQITGTTDPVIQTFSSGRSDPITHDVVGSIMNILPLRVEIDECTTFREVMARTRKTCLEAYGNEIPVAHIGREIPSLMQPLTDPNLCFFITGISQPQFDDSEFQFCEKSYQVRERLVQEPESNEIPQGCAWTLDLLPSGKLVGHVQFNPDEFDEHTMTDWIERYRRILSGVAADPDQAWKSL